METVSIHMPMEGIINCREMAAIPTKDGRMLKSGLLFRSADLHHATKKDLLMLENMGLQNVVDLRTPLESAAAPDELLASMKLHLLPVIREEQAARTEGGQAHLLENTILHPMMSMTEIYPLLVVSPHAIETWKTFFRMLIDQPGSYLWHCTQGKDRTGMAAALLLHALGVDEELIMEDYLQTNLYLQKDSTRDQALAKAFLGKHAGLADRDIQAYMSANRQYYDAAKAAVSGMYGSWDNYLKEALQLSEDDMQALQDYYLK